MIPWWAELPGIAAAGVITYAVTAAVLRRRPAPDERRTTEMPVLTEEDYVFLPVEQATAPPGGVYFQHYVNAWWLVHPEKGLAFYNPKSTRTGRRRHHGLGSPQCNTDERIARMVVKDHAPWPDPEVRFLPSAWVPINISDYRD